MTGVYAAALRQRALNEQGFPLLLIRRTSIQFGATSTKPHSTDPTSKVAKSKAVLAKLARHLDNQENRHIHCHCFPHVCLLSASDTRIRPPPACRSRHGGAVNGRPALLSPSLSPVSSTMAPLDVDSYGISSVTVLIDFFEEALERASAIKPEVTVEPALEDADLEDVLCRLPVTAEATESQNVAGSRQRNSSKFAIIETAARGLLSNLIVRVDLTHRDSTQASLLTMPRPASPLTPLIS